MRASFKLAAALVGAIALPVVANSPAHAGASVNPLYSSMSLLTLVAEGGGGNNSGGGGGSAGDHTGGRATMSTPVAGHGAGFGRRP
jgi:hypothetical protein